MKNRKLFYISLFIFIPLVLLWESASAEPYPNATANKAGPADSAQEQNHTVLYPIKFFMKYISPVDGNRCPMHPSCSKYCLDAVQRHGLLMGWIMTCDRLIRCGRDELKISPTVIVNDTKLSYDPVVNNDF